MKTIEVEPCPFCGSTNLAGKIRELYDFTQRQAKTYHIIVCKDCSAEGPFGLIQWNDCSRRAWKEPDQKITVSQS